MYAYTFTYANIVIYGVHMYACAMSGKFYYSVGGEIKTKHSI